MNGIGIAVVVGLMTVATAVHAADWRGKVVGVFDGDTITVLRGKTRVLIRLHGVDAPEKGQPFGKKAKQRTSRLVFGKTVQVKVVTVGKYGRTVARVYVTHAPVDITRCLNEELVKAGLAWWYRKYAAKDTKLAKLEAAAKKARLGLWKDKAPVPPWTWRKRWKKTPPKLKHSKDRVCQRDRDCVLHERHDCDPCPRQNPAWRTPVNRKTYKQWQAMWSIITCRVVDCPKLRWLGTKAVCAKGQCSVR